MRVFDPRTIELKDGRQIVIRSARDSDVPAVFLLFKLLFQDGEGMIGEADEGPQTEDEVHAWMRVHLDGPSNILLLADFEGTIAGSIDFTVGKRRRTAHWGTFAMGVRPGWRGCGVGDALLTCLLDWATSMPEIEKVTLAVRADNSRAIALYQKHGFVLSGCDREYLKMSDGSFVDDFRMERFVR